MCASPFSRAELNEVLDAVDRSLAGLDGGQALRLLDFVRHEIRCMDAPIRPIDVGRISTQEAVLAWYDQDPDDAIRWGWAVDETLGGAADWPEVTPPALLDALDVTPRPHSVGPEGVGLLPPKGGAILRNGILLTEPKASRSVPSVVQIADRDGVVISTRWEGRSGFAADLLGPPATVSPPRWYEAPPMPAARARRRSMREVAMRFDDAPPCQWKGTPRKVSVTATEISINRQVFPIRTDGEKRSFLHSLRICGEFRAARRFKNWQEAATGLSLTAAKHKKSMVDALLGDEPQRRVP